MGQTARKKRQDEAKEKRKTVRSVQQPKEAETRTSAESDSLPAGSTMKVKDVKAPKKSPAARGRDRARASTVSTRRTKGIFFGLKS